MWYYLIAAGVGTPRYFPALRIRGNGVTGKHYNTCINNNNNSFVTAWMCDGFATLIGLKCCDTSMYMYMECVVFAVVGTFSHFDESFEPAFTEAV